MHLENSGSTEKSGQRVLLSIVERGGYPDFKSMYKSLGYQVLQATTVRKALALFLKKIGLMLLLLNLIFNQIFETEPVAWNLYSQ